MGKLSLGRHEAEFYLKISAFSKPARIVAVAGFLHQVSAHSSLNLLVCLSHTSNRRRNRTEADRWDWTKEELNHLTQCLENSTQNSSESSDWAGRQEGGDGSQESTSHIKHQGLSLESYNPH